MPKAASPYKRHVIKWRDCKLCDLCNHRKKVVLLRGTVPASILFIGEAPGDGEDVIGSPFVGPAGQLLDRIIDLSGLSDYALTNIISCIPKGEDNSKLPEPPVYAAKACKDRLIECVRLVSPKLIVWVGSYAAKIGPKELTGVVEYDSIHILHPANIMRMNISQQGLAVQRCVVALADAVEEL